jgi:hypothetical protein
MDVKSSFLNGDLLEDVYVHQLSGSCKSFYGSTNKRTLGIGQQDYQIYCWNNQLCENYFVHTWVHAHPHSD